MKCKLVLSISAGYYGIFKVRLRAFILNWIVPYLIKKYLLKNSVRKKVLYSALGTFNPTILILNRNFTLDVLKIPGNINVKT